MKNMPLCHKCASAFWAKDVLRDGNSLTFRGCRDDSRITTYSQAELYCPILPKLIDVSVEVVKPVTRETCWARLTPVEWCEMFGVEVIDPDGWRGAMKPDWDTPITRDMFLSRYQMSTTHIKDAKRYEQWRHIFEKKG